MPYLGKHNALLGKLHLRSTWQASHGHVHNGHLPTFVMRYPTPTAGGTDALSVDGSLNVCLPAIKPPPHGLEMASWHHYGPSPDFVMLAEPAMILAPATAPGGSAIHVLTGPVASHAAERQTPTFQPGQPPSGCLAYVRLSMQAAGFTAEVADLAEAARHSSAIKLMIHTCSITLLGIGQLL